MSEVLIEEILVYGIVSIFVVAVILVYIRKGRKSSEVVSQKIEAAKADGLFEPVSLHPVVDQDTCIGSGACIAACPEKDILGIRNGKAQTINASRCIGHGACFHACPVEAITLCIGTEKRGVELPHVSPSFETNVEGIFIAGEIGGMGLIKNAVEQGKQAVQSICATLKGNKNTDKLDLVIIGAGPAGISAALEAKKNKLNFQIFEQDSLGGTVYTFPRAKLVMTSPMDLPLYGKVKFVETNKSELLKLWNKVLSENKIEITERTKIESIDEVDEGFIVTTNQGTSVKSKKVLLTIGRRGTPRKLGIKGENSPNVAYRLLEPENINDKKIIVVGGGDSAIESAMMLMETNEVKLSYRKDKFARIKPKNQSKLKEALEKQKLDVIYNSNLIEIKEEEIIIDIEGEVKTFQNDLVYIFAGGELPTKFLESAGIRITKKFGDAILKHEKK